MAALSLSLTVSIVAALAGLGVLGGTRAPAGAAQTPPSRSPSVDTSGATAGSSGPVQTGQASQTGPTGVDSALGSSHPDAAAETAVPPGSGTGRRIVFSQSEQRVWLMGTQPTEVQRTYLVSGSVEHNLQPGTYAVYAKSRWAVGVGDPGVMQYFVRFTQGPTGSAIGFQTIPTKNGVPLETKAELGTPQSHGCVRQSLSDAIALWNFSGVGTKVVVVA